MKRFLKLAWRNVGRNRRRSLITMCAVVFTVIIIALSNSIQYGTYDLMEGQAVRMLTGEVQIQRTGYQDEKTLAYSLEDSEADWDSLFGQQDWIEARSRRLTGFGLISSDSSSVSAAIIQFRPESGGSLQLPEATPAPSRNKKPIPKGRQATNQKLKSWRSRI